MSTSSRGGICKYVTYCAWNTARSVMGNEKPRRGLTVVVPFDCLISDGSKTPPPGVPRAPNGFNGSLTTYSLALK